VIYLSFVSVQTGEVGCVGFCRKPNRSNKPSCPYLGPVVQVYDPLTGLLVEYGASAGGVELYILFETKFAIKILKVFSEILPVGEKFFVLPVFPKFFFEQLIDGRVTIDTGTGIAIPIPLRCNFVTRESYRRTMWLTRLRQDLLPSQRP
jgi:hypothetical protein